MVKDATSQSSQQFKGSLEPIHKTSIEAMQKTVSISIFLIISTLISGMTIFARELGLDSGAGWGKGRIALLIFGLLIALIPWIVRKRSGIPDKPARTDLFTFPVLLLVIGFYFW